MYQERKFALRFFWLGIFFIMLSGVALGWVKFELYVAIAMTMVFLMFLWLMLYYMVQVTRPRFRFPKTHSRKPKAFYVDGYDPETGKLAGCSAPVLPLPKVRSSNGDPDVVASSEALSQTLREVNRLLQQGHITPQHATEKKAAAIKRHTGTTATPTQFLANAKPDKPLHSAT